MYNIKSSVLYILSQTFLMAGGKKQPLKNGKKAYYARKFSLYGLNGHFTVFVNHFPS